MITETRRAIIELIEPYMDKTLNYNCIVELTEKASSSGKEKIIVLNYVSELDKYINKIIGHYDITAVLKYISLIIGVNIEKIDSDYIFYNHKDYNYLITIPNKPLHLYTEQEEKELLELLIKLN